MQGKKALLAALAGAMLGALFMRVKFQLPALALDRALLAHRGFLLAGVACWALFGVYWEREAKKAAAAKTSEAPSSRGVHLFLTNAALILEIIPIRGLGRLFPVSQLILAAGLGVEIGGSCFAVWARRHLGRNWSGEITIKHNHELIRSGPYRLLRHPIYTGILTMYLGLAILTGEWLAGIGLAVVVFAYGRKIRIEEATLLRAFGEDYAAYRRSTWALLPGLF